MTVDGRVTENKASLVGHKFMSLLSTDKEFCWLQSSHRLRTDRECTRTHFSELNKTVELH